MQETSMDKLLAFAKSYHIAEFKTYINGRHAITGQKEYAHPIDRKVSDLLGQVSVQHSIDQVMNIYTNFTYNNQIRNSVYVTAINYPELYNILLKASRLLNIAMPRMMIFEQAGLNAFTAGADDNCFIMLSSQMVRDFTENELAFVIGHECGHIHKRHVSLRNIASLLVEGGLSAGKMVPGIALLLLPLRLMIGVPLATWSRVAEVTADRAGMIVCQDLIATQSALFKLAGGTGKIDVEDFIKQQKDGRETGGIGQLAGYFASHPYIEQRICAIRIFLQSKLYHTMAGLPSGEHLLDDSILEQQVASIIAM